MNLTTPPHSEAISASLAEMDRKLRELQQELTLAPSAVQSAEPRGAGPPPPDVAPLPRQAVGSGVSAPGTPEAIVDEAHATARRILDDAVAQLGAAKQQIDQLLHLRDFLAESMRVLLADCEQGLTQIETGLPPGTLESAGPPRWAAGTGPLETPVRESPLAPLEPALGRVRLVAGPFRSITAVGELERALARVPDVQRVTVLGFEQASAVMELTVHGRPDLVADLREAMPFAFEVAHRDAQSISLRIVEPLAEQA